MLASLVSLLSPALAGVTVVESYDAAIGQLPEGVAVSPNGTIYVGLAGTGELRRLDGKTWEGETVAHFDVGGGFLLGMAFRGEDLYVALCSFNAETAGIWRVHDDGGTERVVAFGDDEFPNDLTFDDSGNMYVTESIGGAIWKVPAGSTTRELWLQDPRLLGDVAVSPLPLPIGVNGIAYDDETATVVVVNSQVPAVIEVADDGGAAGAVSVLASGEHLRGADGVNIDKKGDLLVVSNFNSSLLRIDRATGAATTLAGPEDGLVFPATAAFGQFGPDKHALFVTNFGFGAGPDAPVGLLRVDVGQKSEKHPAGR